MCCVILLRFAKSENVIKLNIQITNLEKMAGVAGFEPTNDGIKSRCLTAWRYPCRDESINSLIQVCAS
jgi:hypothetical protein